MKKKVRRIVIVGTMTIKTELAYANNGGIAVIKVNEIKLRKITNPYNKIILKGDDANKLKKILSSLALVITSMQPWPNKHGDPNCTISIYPRSVVGGLKC